MARLSGGEEETRYLVFLQRPLSRAAGPEPSPLPACWGRGQTVASLCVPLGDRLPGSDLRPEQQEGPKKRLRLHD